MGEDLLGDRGDPSFAKFINGLIPTIVSQRMTLCALLKTKPVGDVLQSNVLTQPTDDDDEAERMDDETFHTVQR